MSPRSGVAVARAVVGGGFDPPVEGVVEGAVQAVDLARATETTTILSGSVETEVDGDLLDLVADRASADEAFFWERPGDAIGVAARGALAIVSADGSGRFAALADACRQWRSRIISANDAAPLFVGGFAFADERSDAGVWGDMPAARLVLPRHNIFQRNGSRRLTINVGVQADDEPAAVVQRWLEEYAKLFGELQKPRHRTAEDEPCTYAATPVPAPGVWRATVRDTLDDIESGRLEKLVLARSCGVQASVPFELSRVVRRLRRAYAGCTTYWIALPEGDLVGATPEPLAAFHDGEVCTAAVAGSTRRGASSDEDQALAEALLRNTKERLEHRIVARGIVDVLAPVCDAVHSAEQPHVLTLATVQHLVTPIRGRLQAGIHPFDVIARLHPTPAVCGAPRQAALASLQRRESIDRGWYAGAVGWTDGAHEAELSVALRCAFARGTEATLFAGAGIVAGSDPDAEIAETRLKLQPLLAALLEL